MARKPWSIARWLLLLLLALPLSLCAQKVKERMMWTEVTHTFMKDPTLSYGAGDFRIRNGQVLSLKLAEPKIAFKKQTPDELADWNKPLTPTEPWMNNTAETLNRRTVAYMQGPVAGPVVKTLEENAKWGAWWGSRDGKVVYIGTQWYDSHWVEPIGTYGVRIHKLFKSEDYGRTFKQLEWLEGWDSRRFIRFRNPDEGYIIGWGPAIYRTLDGGKTWKSLPIPPAAKDPANRRAEFSVANLDTASGTLLIGFYEHTPEAAFKARSQVWRLSWGKDEADYLFSLPEQTVIDLKLAPEGVYALTYRYQGKEDYYESGQPRDNPETTKELQFWAGDTAKPVAEKLKTFPKEADTGALYRLPSGTLAVDSVKDNKDVLFISRDSGKSWTEENEGTGAQGVYFDEETGERYRVEGYSLYKRIIK
jgi:hypothetical protein